MKGPDFTYEDDRPEENKNPMYPALRTEEFGEEVSISVSDPGIREETLSKHVVYTVRVTHT
jgi:hypothetical protein